MSRGISAPRHPSWTKDVLRLQRRTIDHCRACDKWMAEGREAGFEAPRFTYPILVARKFRIALYACEYMGTRTSGRAAATWSRRAGILRGELERMSVHG